MKRALPTPLPTCLPHVASPTFRRRLIRFADLPPHHPDLVSDPEHLRPKRIRVLDRVSLDVAGHQVGVSVLDVFEFLDRDQISAYPRAMRRVDPWGVLAFFWNRHSVLFDDAIRAPSRAKSRGTKRLFVQIACRRIGRPAAARNALAR
jgi:hypothetical protein